ncbi:uncharacterized protein [Panulirus ornatus]|uniref:uncharacterized protein isoform X2 n=1 Tax=Panulirus ornatus TaxID=150431 RepID=UPI003A84744A
MPPLPFSSITCRLLRLPLLHLQQLLLLVMVLTMPGKGQQFDKMPSGTSPPFLELVAKDHPVLRASDATSANTSFVGQVFVASDSGMVSNSSLYQPGNNSTSSTLPTAQPLIQKWNRVQHIFPMRPISHYQLSNSRKDFLQQNYQRPLRSTQYPLRRSPNSRRHSANTQKQKQTKTEHSYSQNQKNNPGSNPQAQHREDTFEIGFRNPSDSLPNQFYPPRVTQRYVPHPNPFGRSQQFPQQSQVHHNVQQKVYRLLPDEQSERYLKEPGPEISVHDLTSAFYTARELLSSSSVLKTSSTRNTNGAASPTNSQRSFSTSTNSKRPSLNPQHDYIHPRAPPDSYYRTQYHKMPQHTKQWVYDLNHYPPSVAYRELYFDHQRPPRITQNLQEADHSHRKKMHYTPNSNSRDGQQKAQSSLSNTYNFDPITRQHSVDHYLANQNLKDPVYRNQEMNSRKTTVRLNYARLPNGYESPTTTFEDLISKGKDGNISVTRRKKIRFDIKRPHPTVQVNGHSRPHFTDSS